MNGPCLCGDPACGRCFPLGQQPMRCVQRDCDWAGPRYECGSEELSEGIVDTCPECGCDARLDLVGEEIDPLAPMPLAVCSYCGVIYEDGDQHLDSWWPYCSQRCALDAESESGEDA